MLLALQLWGPKLDQLCYVILSLRWMLQKDEEKKLLQVAACTTAFPWECWVVGFAVCETSGGLSNRAAVVGTQAVIMLKWSKHSGRDDFLEVMTVLKFRMNHASSAFYYNSGSAYVNSNLKCTISLSFRNVGRHAGLLKLNVKCLLFCIFRRTCRKTGYVWVAPWYILGKTRVTWPLAFCHVGESTVNVFKPVWVGLFKIGEAETRWATNSSWN